MTQRQHDERGAVMVELAIVLPLLIMLLMGIIEFGRAYNTQISLQAAAREGARELALGKSDVEARVRSAALPVAVDSITHSAPCSATGDGQATVEVKVKNEFTFRIPFVPDLGAKTLSATAVMRCEPR